jgi:hypothetical protein
MKAAVVVVVVTVAEAEEAGASAYSFLRQGKSLGFRSSYDVLGLTGS